MTSARPDDAARALDLLRTGQRFLLCGHVRPDGDCLGGEVALGTVLRKLGKEVTLMNPDGPAPEFDYLVAHHPIHAWKGELPPHDVAVLLDINELSRTGPLAEPLAAAPSKKVVVDHHVPAGEPWWDAAYLDVTASATGLLCWRLARELGVEPDRAIAEAVFTSLVTDTGWFRYSNTDAETVRTAAALVELGVEPWRIYDALYQRRPATEPRALGAVLQRAEYHAQGRLAVVDVPLVQNGAPPLIDSDPVLDHLREVGTVEVVLFLRELEGGVCKLSARSKTDFDVNLLARRFGGGGHKKASGATLQGPLAEVKGALVAAALEGLEGQDAEAEPAR